jgi:hypothetical protein
LKKRGNGNNVPKSTQKSNPTQNSPEAKIRRDIEDSVWGLIFDLKAKYPGFTDPLDIALESLAGEKGRTIITIKNEHYAPMAEFEAQTERPINDMLDEWMADAIECNLSTDIEGIESRTGKRMNIALPEHPVNA